MRLLAPAALLLLAGAAAHAHGSPASRTLRLQLQADGVEGLLVYRATPQQARLFAVPAVRTPLALRVSIDCTGSATHITCA